MAPDVFGKLFEDIEKKEKEWKHVSIAINAAFNGIPPVHCIS